ncbi:UV radiation resistance protein and autophagy-related subunit 14-domain-containing protein [Lineolata rhizophorae]|uniref:Autophagy-related protein 14 n=1 Tax=Lineolata rhizophorae TaxID=578093 RepID=A0A6A6P7M2_9PEZI|nr:UV radiation resistance protein and autophagy-related subunit 14-domain-containing protein [Lineolata rhizophorae]
MECDICGTLAGGANQPGLHCASCARASLYPLRIEQARSLLERERLGEYVGEVIHGASTPSDRGGSSAKGAERVDTLLCTSRVEYEQTCSATAEAEDRVAQITGQMERLKIQIEEGKRQIKQKRAENAQRRSDAASATHQLAERRAQEMERVKERIRIVRQRWDSVHRSTLEGRRALCKEAGVLAGLKVRRRKTRDGNTTEHFQIGGLRIYDLTELNIPSEKHLTASLTYMAHLIVRVSHYLGIRLPAEITLPKKDYPLPTIFSPPSSYKARDVPFPGTTPSQSQHNSPDASKMFDNRPLPTPRPLYIDRVLPKLSKEEPQTYSLFVEGVALLAFDIAWLCKSQGVDCDFTSFADICTIGRNLWLLLVRQPMLSPSQSIQDLVENATDDAPKPLRRVNMGEHSHATAHSFLPSATQGLEYMDAWRIGTLTKVIDKVKTHLTQEMQGAEWEVLDEKEWEMDPSDPLAQAATGQQGTHLEEELVLVGERRKDQSPVGSGPNAQTKMPRGAVKSNHSRNSSRSGGGGAAQGKEGEGPATANNSSNNKGWTKVKSRRLSAGYGEGAASSK